MKAHASRPTPSRRRFDETEALEAAMRVFWQHGYAATSMAMLLSAMGLTAPSLYAAFGNKDQLFKTAVTHYSKTRGAAVYASLKDPELPVRQAIRAMFNATISLLAAADSPAGCLVAFGAVNCGEDSEEITRFLRELRKTRERQIRERLRRAVKDGELPQGFDYAGVAKYLQTMSLGIRLQSLEGATRRQLQSLADEAFKILPPPPKANLQTNPRRPQTNHKEPKP